MGLGWPLVTQPNILKILALHFNTPGNYCTNSHLWPSISDILSLLLYYCIKSACGNCRSTSNPGDERIFTLESLPQEATLPPSYSGLSVHLLPTYSQACRIIGYNRPSSESITRTEPYLEQENVSCYSEESNNNVLNFPSTSNDVHF
ncbi:unnamed protein product [Mytilus edulis]|uniref:Uncharacterized protein n=1 Tax=Mytilus edulis TaxID=6550 RepID=A0A8S3UEG6_MYTED|nr:unnamed protein product [Mytilus edulis]